MIRSAFALLGMVVLHTGCGHPSPKEVSEVIPIRPAENKKVWEGKWTARALGIPAGRLTIRVADDGTVTGELWRMVDDTSSETYDIFDVHADETRLGFSWDKPKSGLTIGGVDELLIDAATDKLRSYPRHNVILLLQPDGKSATENNEVNGGGWRCHETKSVPLSGRPTVGSGYDSSTTHEPQAFFGKTLLHKEPFHWQKLDEDTSDGVNDGVFLNRE